MTKKTYEETWNRILRNAHKALLEMKENGELNVTQNISNEEENARVEKFFREKYPNSFSYLNDPSL